MATHFPTPQGDPGAGRHHCLIHHSAEEVRGVVARFIEEGVELGRKVILVSPDTTSEAFRVFEAHLAEDWSGSQERDQVEFLDLDAAFGGAEGFDRYRAVTFVREAVARARADGFSGLHLIQELGSLGRGHSGLRDLTAYEAGLNLILAEKPCAVLCLYDRDRSTPEVLLRCLELHPSELREGLRQLPNPFYQPEVEFRVNQGESLVEDRLRILRRMHNHERPAITHDPDALLARVSRRVELEGNSLDAVARIGLEEIGRMLPADRSAYHLVDTASDLLVEGGVGAGNGRRARGQGLAGRAWIARRPVWSSGSVTGADSSDGRDSSAVPGETGLALPLPGGQDVQGVIEFVIRDASEPDEALMERLEPVARLLGEALARIRAESRLGSAGEGLGGLLASAGEGIIVTDPEGRIRSWNLAAAQLLEEEGSWEVPVGRPLADLLPPDARDGLRRALSLVTGSDMDGPRSSVEFRVHRAPGDQPPLFLSLTSWQADGGERCCVVAIRDALGERKDRLDARVIESLSMATSGNPLLLLTGNTRWGGPSILHANAAFCRLLGFSESELLGRSLHSLTGPAAGLEPMMTLAKRLAAGEPGHLDFMAQRKDGLEIPLRLEVTPILSDHGQVSHFVAVPLDQAQERHIPALPHGTGHDPLTGLATRELFTKVLRRSLERFRRNPDMRFAVLFLDLDGFKEVNDDLGHVRGDELLVAVARRLEEAVRPEDVLVRFGGDEFVILLEYIEGLSDVIAVAERIRSRLSRPFHSEGSELTISASIGIALSDSGYSSVEEVIRDADSAMYRAKEEGSGGFRIFDRTLREEARLAGELRSDLQESLDRGEFRLHYQPLMDLASGRISGLEALLRWAHPERGIVAATEFIGHAEAMKLIVPLGEWVVRESSRQLRRWQDRLGEDVPITMSMNLSTRELLDPHAREWFEQAIEETGVDPALLRVEVSESFFSRPQADVDAALGPLRALGIRIGIDEFGMGTISIGRLHQLPVDFLKIDRRFVTSLPHKGMGNGRAVRAILAMAQSLGLDVVAPGVETTMQEELLRELACTTVQGYLFSAPVDAEKAGLLLEARNARRKV